MVPDNLYPPNYFLAKMKSFHNQSLCLLQWKEEEEEEQVKKKKGMLILVILF